MDDTKLFYGSLIAMFVMLTIMLIDAGWFNFHQNQLINDCIHAGNVWKDGKCVKS